MDEERWSMHRVTFENQVAEAIEELERRLPKNPNLKCECEAVLEILEMSANNYLGAAMTAATARDNIKKLKKHIAELEEKVTECESRLDVWDRRLAKWARKMKLEE